MNLSVFLFSFLFSELFQFCLRLISIFFPVFNEIFIVFYPFSQFFPNVYSLFI